MFQSRTAPYSRRRYRQALRQYLLANWFLLIAVSTLLLSVGAVIQVFVHGYVLGAIHGALVGMLILAITSSFLVHTNSTGQLAGAWGEELTRDELAKAKRRGLIWGWVDSIERNGADVDHLASIHR